jgi:GAF domain-containing protein
MRRTDKLGRSAPFPGPPASPERDEVLHSLLRALEVAGRDQFFVSVLLLDEAGTHLTHCAAPSLPEPYCAAIDGVAIGPNVGSCGTAAFLGHSVFVTDIATDPHWVDYRAVALEHGLRACWSVPLTVADGQVIGTFAIYHPVPRSPTESEVDAIRLMSKAVLGVLMLRYGQGQIQDVLAGSTPPIRSPAVAG